MAQRFLAETSDFTCIDLASAARAKGLDIEDIPYVIRVLIENLLRHREWGEPISEGETDALWHWQTHRGADLPLHVSRVILPDSSGLPVLLDLAALRDALTEAGGDATQVDVRIPVDLIVDHSLQVDNWGDSGSIGRNLQKEFQRNDERYRFLKWAQQAYRGLRVFPPGTGIIHQINLEYIASVVTSKEVDGRRWAYPDFVIGGDSHTPMVNALGVLGWGVGGIDAEAAMLGHAYTFPIPEVVGVRLIGEIQPPAMTTDLVLLVTETLREADVAGTMVEYFGPAVASLTVPERATLSNMAPEYGATCGFFPIDQRTLHYLRTSGRDDAHVALVERYAEHCKLFRNEARTPAYSRVIEIDLRDAVPSLAGPRRPQDRIALPRVRADFNARLRLAAQDGGFATSAAENRPPPPFPAVVDTGNTETLAHGAIVIAALTSCTNTSNPSVMLAAGLLAKHAIERGLTPPSWVKRSLAPGSRVVTRYLEQSGLLAPLEALGFYLVGYGCTTCGGKSGPLDEHVAAEITSKKLVVAAVLSGNRNFEGRIHKLVRANYIGAPPLVVAYALAGRIDFDFEREPLGRDASGLDVYLKDIWPEQHEIDALLPLAANRALFAQTYSPGDLDSEIWNTLPAPQGHHFAWDPASLYLVQPPFFSDALTQIQARAKSDTSGPGVSANGAHANGQTNSALGQLSEALRGARVLALFGDSLTTDHISPGGEIPQETPAGRYLMDAGVAAKDFNTYVARRCNHHVMARATFANIRVRNLLAPGSEGGITRHFPSDKTMSIFDAANAYRRDGVATIVLAGKEYGTGSSRDWAAKGSALLGVRAIIAESYERIHRANLIGMGIVPFLFAPGQSWKALGLDGTESFRFEGLEDAVMNGGTVDVTASGNNGDVRFVLRPAVLTSAERHLLANGGMMVGVLNDLLPSDQKNNALTEV